MRTVRSKTLANAMDQKTRSNRALGKQNREQLSEESRFHKSREIAENLMSVISPPVQLITKNLCKSS